MSDGISEMYREASYAEKNRIFLHNFSKCLLGDKKVNEELVESAMVAADLPRELMGHFGWRGDSEYKTCKDKMTSCIEKLANGDKEEWALFIKLYLQELYSGSEEWNKLIAISPFRDRKVAVIARGNGLINVYSAGMSSYLWDMAKKALGKKWEKWNGYALLSIKVEDSEIIPMPKERNEKW